MWQSQKQVRKAARRAFHVAPLRDIIERDERDFGTYADRFTVGRGRYYYHRDNGSDILAVAHLDTVQRQRWCYVQGPIVRSPVLDDRLGAYVILDLLPRLGVKADILLTMDEENCDSTAANFEPTKEYNWTFEFDRAGTDVVMYQYDTAENRALLADVKAPVGDGSYSDIACLDHLGVCGFNWGVGYHDYHEVRGWARLQDTFLMVSRFVDFYQRHRETRLPFDAARYYADLEESYRLRRDQWRPRFCHRCWEPLDLDGYCVPCALWWWEIQDDDDDNDMGLGAYLERRRLHEATDDEWRELDAALDAAN